MKAAGVQHHWLDREGEEEVVEQERKQKQEYEHEHPSKCVRAWFVTKTKEKRQLCAVDMVDESRMLSELLRGHPPTSFNNGFHQTCIFFFALMVIAV